MLAGHIKISIVTESSIGPCYINNTKYIESLMYWHLSLPKSTPFISDEIFLQIISENDFFLLAFDLIFRAPPVCLLPHSHYEHVMTAFGGKGYFVQTPEELQKSLRQSLADMTKPSLINIMIEPQAMRKAQVKAMVKQKAEMRLLSQPPKYLSGRTPYYSILSKHFWA